MAANPLVGIDLPSGGGQIDSFRRPSLGIPTLSLAPGLNSLANAAEEISAKQQAALDKSQAQNAAVEAGHAVADFRLKATQALADGQSQYQGDPNFAGNYINGLKTMQADAIKSASTPLAKNYIERELTSAGSDFSDSAVRWQAGQNVAARFSKSADAWNKIATTVGIDPSQFDQAVKGQMTADSQLPEGQSKTETVTRGINEAAWSATLGLIRADPQSVMTALDKQDTGNPALDRLTAEQRDRARVIAKTQATDNTVQTQSDAVLEVYRANGQQAGSAAYAAVDKSDLSPELKDKVRERIGTGVSQLHAQMQQVHGQAIGDLEERISNGSANDSDRGLVRSLFNQNALTGDQMGAALGGIDRAQRKTADDADTMAFFSDAYAKSKPLTPNQTVNKQGIDLLFQSMTPGVAPGSQDWTNRAVDISAKTGVVPTSAAEWSLANLVSGKPKDAATAALVIERLTQTNPRGIGYAIGEPERALAMQIYQSTQAGTDPETAVNMARQNAQISPAQRQILSDQWKQQTGFAFGTQYSMVDSSTIRSGLADDPHYASQSILGAGVPQPPVAMTAEFNQLVKDYFYHTNGNVQQAQQLAIDSLKGVWGVHTDTDGTRSLMKYAPERMVPGLTTPMMDADIGASLKKLGIEPTGPVKLAESPADTASSLGLIWNLTMPGKFSNYEIIRDKNQQAFRYMLPDPGKAGAELSATQRAEDMKRLQAEQEIQSVQAARSATGIR